MTKYKPPAWHNLEKMSPGNLCTNGHVNTSNGGSLRYNKNGMCVQCSKDAQVRWRKNNPDRSREHSRSYRAEYPDRKSDQNRRYHNRRKNLSTADD